MAKPVSLARIVLTTLLSGLFLCSYAQQKVTPDPRLSECFSSTELTDMQNNKPDLMSYYNYMLNHSYYTTSLKSEKPINGTNIHTVKVKPEFSAGKDQFFNVSPKNATAASINILKYDFKTDSKNFTTYIWKEAGIAVIFYPKDIVLREYNTLKKTNNLQ